jgi:hypothetical protein
MRQYRSPCTHRALGVRRRLVFRCVAYESLSLIGPCYIRWRYSITLVVRANFYSPIAPYAHATIGCAQVDANARSRHFALDASLALCTTVPTFPGRIIRLPGRDTLTSMLGRERGAQIGFESTYLPSWHRLGSSTPLGGCGGENPAAASATHRSGVQGVHRRSSSHSC